MNSESDASTSSGRGSSLYTPLVKKVTMIDPEGDEGDGYGTVLRQIANDDQFEIDYLANERNNMEMYDEDWDSDTGMRTRRYRYIMRNDTPPELVHVSDSSGDEYVPMKTVKGHPFDPRGKRTKRKKVTVSKWLSTKKTKPDLSKVF
jgi:hypothetical protein